jgi:hypothetical protein
VRPAAADAQMTPVQFEATTRAERRTDHRSEDPPEDEASRPRPRTRARRLRQTFLRRRLAVAVVFLFLAGLELWSPIVEGRWYVASDIGQLAPLTRNPSQPSRASNALQSDVYSEIAPFLANDVRSVRSGRLPTWNPHNGNGQPYLANYQSAVFSPFTWFFYVLSFRLALVAAALARLWLLGFFTFLFLRRHEIGEFAAVVGGALFMFAGYHLVWQNYPIAAVSAWLPLCLWCAKVALDHPDPPSEERRRRTLALGGLSVSLGAMLLAGNPETATFDILLVAAYVVASTVAARVAFREACRRLAYFAGAALVAFGLAAVQLLPFAQYERGSTFASAHHSPVPGFNLSSFPVTVFPNLFGGPQFSYYDAAFYRSWLHPVTNYAELNGNAIGLIGTCLAVVGIVSLLRRRRTFVAWFGAACAAVGALLLYSHFAGALWEHVPGIGTAYLNRSQDVELLGICVLAALGVDWIVGAAGPNAEAAHKARVLAAATAAFAVITTVVVLWALSLRHDVAQVHGRSTDSGRASAFAHDQLLVAVLLAAGFLVATGLFCWARRSSSLRPLSAGLASLCVFASTGLAMRTYNPGVSSSVAYPKTTGTTKLESLVGQDEVLFAAGAFGTGETSLWYGLNDVSAYDSVGLVAHDRLYRSVFHVSNDAEQQMPWCPEGLRLFGVRWVVGGDGHFSGPFPALVRSGSIAGVPYFRVGGSTPYSFVTRAVGAGSPAAELRVASSCGFDPDGEVVLPAGEAARAPTTPGSDRSSMSDASVRQVSSSPSRLVFATTSARAGWLVVRQAWAPGWGATLDSRGVGVERSDAAFDAVSVPAGRHLVVLSYAPTPLALGKWVSAMSLAGLAGLVAYGLADPSSNSALLRNRSRSRVAAPRRRTRP